MWWNYILVYVGFGKLRWLAHQNNFPIKNPTAVDNCDKVVCTEFEFFKAYMSPDGASRTKPMEDKQSESNKEYLCSQLKGYQYITISSLFLSVYIDLGV